MIIEEYKNDIRIEYSKVPPVPEGEPPMATLPPLQIVLSLPAFASTSLTLTVILADFEHPVLAVTITVYVVVEVGDAVGLAIIELLKPVVGIHW